MTTASTGKRSYLIPILIIGALFFVFGFVTWVNGTLIPYLKLALELTTGQAVWVTFAFYISYAVMAFPSSWVLKRTGLKKGMMLGLLTMAVGAVVFVPAAYSREFALFLTGLFIIGTGLALLQTASNPYVTILGPIESAAKRMSIMGICNKGAGALAPLIIGAFLLKDADRLEEQLVGLTGADKTLLLEELASRVVWPYVVMALVLVILAVAVRFSGLPDISHEEETDPEHAASVPDKKHWWNYTYLLLGFLALFLYVGAEVVAGDIIQTYGTSLGIKLSVAKHFTTYTMIGMLVGYLLGIVLIPKYLKQEKALVISAVLGVIFTLGIIFTDGITSITFLALLGFANAAVWPAIWPLAIDGLGKHLETGSALLIIAIGGGAVVPQIWAYLEGLVGGQKAFWILIPCYLFILFFAVKGHKIGKTRKTKEV